MLPSYIKTELDSSRKFKVVLQKFLYENSFNPWMNILNFKKVKNYVLLEQTYERLDMHALICLYI